MALVSLRAKDRELVLGFGRLDSILAREVDLRSLGLLVSRECDSMCDSVYSVAVFRL